MVYLCSFPKTERMYGSSVSAPACRSTMRSHKRPLRTYSQRASSSDCPEPSCKKQRTGDQSVAKIKFRQSSLKETSDDETKPDTPPITPPITPSISEVRPVSPVTRGTIFAYFRKIPNPTHRPSLPPQSSVSAVEADTTPSAPLLPSSTRRKKIRRLTTKVSSRDVIESDFEDNAGERPEAIESASTNEVPISPTSQSFLGDADSRTGNLDKGLSRPETGTRRCGKKTSKATKVATVQTTLSLSITDQGFTECKECNMLYNPLHEKDARLHARRHAALRKVQLTSKTSIE
ncbi:hypothetical protein F5Y15DRAFT_366619 [Xylariaceae sp. FL0016]|nr:hypothetical protein F5Y15DRAFT_366619 [Xylariaceae sp. FL0016]